MKCEICGKEINCNSIIEFIGGYGSDYDLEKIEFKVCAECFDLLLSKFQTQAQQTKEKG